MDNDIFEQLKKIAQGVLSKRLDEISGNCEALIEDLRRDIPELTQFTLFEAIYKVLQEKQEGRPPNESEAFMIMVIAVLIFKLIKERQERQQK